MNLLSTRFLKHTLSPFLLEDVILVNSFFTAKGIFPDVWQNQIRLLLFLLQSAISDS